ncbi:hypothetical protein Phage2-1_00013 [Achromobacter phage 2-1]|nr:hypothetical protein Phage2-1_00013 [Achromobacter phage 2-1]
MQWGFVNEEYSFTVQATVDGVPVISDDGKAWIYTRNQAGDPVEPWDSPVTMDGTSVFITLPESTMTVGSGNETEARHVMIRYTSQGAVYERRITVGVTPFISIEADADMVRSVLGVSAEELPDTDVDTISAYYDLKSRYKTPFVSKVKDGITSIRRGANQLVAITAALEVIPSLQLRTYQTRQDENAMFTRFRGIDWDRLIGDLQARMGEILVDIGIVGDVTELYPTLFIVSTPTDPVTNQ